MPRRFSNTGAVDDDARVRIRLDENGRLAGLEVDGEVDKSTLVEEVRPDLAAPLAPEVGEQSALGF